LEEFAYGNISPEVQTFRKDSRFMEAMDAACKNEERLLGKLNNDDRDVFNKYMDAQGEVIELTAMRNFICGYKLGVIMTAEAFVTSGELVGKE